MNLFLGLFSKGGVDLTKVKDTKLQEALLEQIFHYGQTPLQIFQKPHPQRQTALIKGKIQISSLLDVNIYRFHLFINQ